MNNTVAIPIATNQEGKIDINQYEQNLEQCLKGSYHYGYVEYHNVCTGESYVVPNGFWDLSLGLVLLTLGILVIIVVLKAIFD